MDLQAIAHFHGFRSPQWLWLLAAVPALALADAVAARYKTRRLAAQGDLELLDRQSPDLSRAKRGLRKVLGMVGLTLSVIAMAGPVSRPMETLSLAMSLDVVFCVDVSRSMLAADVHPTRLSRAVTIAGQIMHEMPGDRFGLVAFAGLGLPQCPVTTSRDIVQEHLAALRTTAAVPAGYLGKGGLPPTLAGTNMADGLRQARDLLERGRGSADRMVVLISDGENHEGDPAAAAAELNLAGIRLVTITVGTTEGAPVPWFLDGSSDLYLKDDSGNLVISKADEGLMERLAHATAGATLHGSSPSVVKDVAAFAAALHRASLEKVERASEEQLYQLPLLAGLMLLLTAMCMSERLRAGRLRRAGSPPATAAALAGLACIVASTTGFDISKKADSEVSRAIEDIRAGRFEHAEQILRDALDSDPSEPVLHYDLALALCGTGDSDAAAAEFEEAARLASSTF